MQESTPHPQQPGQGAFGAKKTNVVVELLESIKFSHTIFALPFAILALVLARRGGLPTVREALLIVLCMVGARTWAMGVNRLADAHIDAKNPRTSSRAVPAGRLSSVAMATFAGTGAVVFLGGAAALSPVALACALPVLLILASYSWAKRLSFLCHFYLGFCLGLAPLGAWVALRGEFPWRLLTLTFGIAFWVAGFDILYALQDEQFDRETGLHSVPAKFGTAPAIFVARASHLVSAVLFLTFGLLFELGVAYFAGLALAGVLMIWQHRLTRGGDLSRIGMAFFNLNGWISVLLFFSASLSLLAGF
ncbi:MAG: UbiA family prenyltransferase [Silvanigrellales bacterium]|nr:UbiA family prenyltransferase [Silvanigrellales bacterium]